MGIYTDRLYCCGVDYYNSPPKIGQFYEEIDELKKQKTCWRACGIIMVTNDEHGNELSSCWIKNEN